ncbi:MAG: ATP-binding protein [Pyrinomonadaceae bacterium]
MNDQPSTESHEWIGASTDISERNAQEALRRSEERLRVAVDAAQLGAWELNLATGALECTARCKANFGLPPDSFLSYETLFASIHPDDRAGVRAAVERAIQRHEVYEAEYRVIWPDRSQHWVRASGSALHDEHGQPQRMVGVTLDITDTRQKERTLQFLIDLNQATQPLADADEIMSVTARLLGSHLGANRCAYAEVEADEDHFRITGDYTLDTFSVVGRFQMSSFGIEARRLMVEGTPYVVDDVTLDERVGARLPTYRQTEIAAVVSVPLHKEGRFVAGMAVHQKTPRHWTPEEVELIRLVVNRCWESIERARAVRRQREAHDELERRVAERTTELLAAVSRLRAEVAERERAEATLQKEQEYLEATLENIEDGVVACDAGGVLTFFNRATREFHGLPEEPLSAEQWAAHYDLFLADGQTRMKREEIPLFRALHGERVRSMEMVIAPKHGPRHRLLASGRALYGASGDKLGAVVVMHDITTQRQAEEERVQLIREREARKAAEESNRLKDEFLATVSHELRTPLTAILGWADMLRAGQLDEKTVAAALDTIGRNARAQNQLIEDLLDVSRIITGKLRLDMRPVELAPVIEMAAESVRPAAEAKDIRLHVLLDTQAGPISGDDARLQQVVWNLLTNAVKFTPNGGRVEVRLERINSHVEVTVSDSGRGIDPKFLPHVFDRFRQADQTTTRSHGGLGLGLSIVRQLVELHGGTVYVESEGAGRGATFVVQLPLMNARRQNSEMPERRHPQPGVVALPGCPPQLVGLRVLVVDDEEDSRDLLRMVLEQCGVEVTTAGSAAEALELYKRSAPDILLSDIGMPEEDGYELIRKVRAWETQKDGGRVPAIALTAYARVQDRVRALNAGYQVHVPKPTEPLELIAVVASLAGRTGTV